MNAFALVTEPPAPVTTTSTAPASLAGMFTVTEVAPTLVIVVPAVPSNVTADVPVKLVPVIVTVVPPAVGPEANPVADNTDVIVGVSTYVKPCDPVMCPPEPVTTTSTAPASLAGMSTVTEVALTLVIVEPSSPSNVTADVPVKLVPVIVTVVPPAVEPDANPVVDSTEVIVGVPTYVKAESEDATPPAPVSVTANVPVIFAGETTVIEFALTLWIDVPAVPPNVTADVL